MVAAKMANMTQGQRNDLEHSANLPNVSQVKASEMLSVGDRTVRVAKQVIKNAVPELRDMAATQRPLEFNRSQICELRSHMGRATGRLSAIERRSSFDTWS